MSGGSRWKRSRPASSRHSDVKLDPQPQLGFPGSDEGNIAQDAFVPAGYAAYRLNDRIVLGVGINVPFGLATEYDEDSILNQTGVAGKSEVFSLNVNPAVSVEVTDWLALALGAQIQYFDARLTRQALGPLGVSTARGRRCRFRLHGRHQGDRPAGHRNRPRLPLLHRP